MIRSPFGIPSMNCASVSSRLSLPSSTSCRIAVAVNDLVMLAMRTWSAIAIGAPVSRSPVPKDWTRVPRPGIQIPTLSPGSRLSAMAFSTMAVSAARSASGNSSLASEDPANAAQPEKMRRRATASQALLRTSIGAILPTKGDARRKGALPQSNGCGQAPSRDWLWRAASSGSISVGASAAGFGRRHISPGPYRSLRELSLCGPVGPRIRRPPTL